MSYRGYERKNSEDEISGDADSDDDFVVGQDTDEEFHDEPPAQSTTRSDYSSRGGGGGDKDDDDDDEVYAPSTNVLILLAILVLLLGAGIGVGTYFAYEKGLFERDETPEPTPEPTTTPPPTIPPPQATPPPTLSPQPSPIPSNAPTGPPLPPTPTTSPVTSAPVEFFTCSICGEGLFVTDYDGMYSVDGQPDRSCSDLVDDAMMGNINSIQCGMIQNDVQDICGCASERTDASVFGLLETVVGPGVSEDGTILNAAANWLLYEDPRFEPLEARRMGIRKLQECNICGDGMEITNPSGIVMSSGVNVTCESLQGLADNGDIDVEQCTELQNVTEIPCDCSLGGPNSTNPSPTLPPPTENMTLTPTLPPNENMTLSDISNEELIQRYLVALLYYQTTNNRQEIWNSDCRAIGDGSPAESETNLCNYVTPERFANGELAGGDQASIASRWLSSDFECNWGGITCIDEEVESISLVNFNLRGSLSTEILELPLLRGLDFAHNNVTGTIPSGYLPKLHGLNLNHNQLEGDEFGSPELWENSVVLSLNVGANQLSGLLPTDTNPSLQQLFAYSNALLGTVPTYYLAGAIDLLVLDVSENSFIGNMPPIIQENPEKGVVDLNLSGNQLEGTIAVESTKLMSLWLNDNRFQGTIPSSLGNVTSLTSLHLAGNIFTGSLPTTLGNLVLLESLDITNQLSIGIDGLIPTELASISGLKSLRISQNFFTGNLPVEFGQLTELEELEIHENSLDGTIPTELLGLSDLSVFTLDNNEFTGSVPFCDVEGFDFDLLRADCFEILCTCCTSCCSRSACTDVEIVVR